MSLRIENNLRTIRAAAVHALTATGGVIGLLALMAASNGNWTGAFAWLGLALIVDGADGPLARRFDVKQTLPRFSGENLDITVDYLNYVTVPAFIVAQSSILPAKLRLPFAAMMMLVSLYHFADTKSKTIEGYFVGFPAIWNIIVLYCFVLGLPPALSACLIGACAFLTFIPLYWVHPLRVKRLRPLTFAIVLAWAVASAAALYHGFPGSLAEKLVFALAALYVVAVSLSAGEQPAVTPIK